MSDRILVRELREGNERAFEVLFKYEFENVVFFANQFVRNELVARDVAQESFIALWSSRERLSLDKPVLPYLYRIVRNRALNVLRDKLHKASVLEKAGMECDMALLKDDVLESVVDAGRLERIIAEAWESLPGKIRESFILSRRDGLSYDEIAMKRGLDKKAVEYQISLALKHFRKRLGGYMRFFLVLKWFWV